MDKNKRVKQKMEYSYDPLHRLSGVKYGDGKPFHYEYDAADNLISVEPGEAAPGPKETARWQAGPDKELSPEPNWYLHRQGEQYGPYSWEELIHFAQQGNLQPADLLWQQGMDQWVGADTIEGLF
ncbi:MAG: DUF4339 domain-containing protein [Candidatus Syntrophonatronum acetioxidans]|uniref:DUF4339 domain-containing protein n=1 Tax=Candidatus Syntrophonatronum acetioxidans TaxID=1795816 RepID=A0A424Y953_9FIRM|nr:MAG: DUF4339 domain-containing protein [Candidatus Syntrophonatronum acetioxidans]